MSQEQQTECLSSGPTDSTQVAALQAEFERLYSTRTSQNWTSSPIQVGDFLDSSLPGVSPARHRRGFDRFSLCLQPHGISVAGEIRFLADADF